MMNKIAVIFLLFLVSTDVKQSLFAQNTSNVDITFGLPKNIPSDISIHYYKSPGMSGQGFDFRIENGKATYIKKIRADSEEIKIKVTKKEIETLYQVLRSSRVEQISLDQAFINDFDDYSLELKWKANTVSVVQSGQQIKKEYAKDWQQVRNAFAAIIAKVK